MNNCQNTGWTVNDAGFCRDITKSCHVCISVLRMMSLASCTKNSKNTTLTNKKKEIQMSKC